MNEEEKKVEEPVVQENPEVKEEPVVQPEPVVQEEPKKEEVPQETNDNKKKNNKTTVIALLVIIAILIGVIVFMVLGAIEKKNKERPKEENTQVEPTPSPTPEPTPTPTPVVKEELSEDETNNIMEQFNGIKLTSDDRLYENEKFDISSIDDNELLITAVSQFDVYNTCSKMGESDFTLSQLNEELNKYVDKSLTIDFIRSISGSEWRYYRYNLDITVDDDETIHMENHNCGDVSGPQDYVYSNIVSGEKEGDYVYIYEKKAFGTHNGVDENGKMLVDYYKDYNKTGEVVETLVSKNMTYRDDNPEDKIPNWDLYNTYKYTFKLVNGTYYFQTLELVK
jgi:hypothetical protein